MIEKVNPCHPDKVADRIAGAVVDLAYEVEKNQRSAVEVLIGHGYCHIIAESSVKVNPDDVYDAVVRILGTDEIAVKFDCVPQDVHLANNQSGAIKCGDNGIFKGSPLTAEQLRISQIAREIYEAYPHDGKYILNGRNLTVCQSNADSKLLRDLLTSKYRDLWIRVNPLGDWTGGTNVDTGATNRKLGSDMGDGVTGGGLHGKDLSKADVSANIWCHIKAQELGKEVKAWCAIGDEYLHTSEGEIPYADVVEVARKFINDLGGFEKFAEWGLF